MKMYYISSLKNGKCGVTDTKDGVEEFVTLRDLQKLHNIGVSILGVDIPKWEVNVVTYDTIPDEYLFKYVNKKISEQLPELNKMKLEEIFKTYDMFAYASEFVNNSPMYDTVPWNSPDDVKDLGLHFYDWGTYYIDWNGNDYIITCSAVNDNALGDYIRDDLENGAVTILDILRCENVEVKYK